MHIQDIIVEIQNYRKEVIESLVSGVLLSSDKEVSRIALDYARDIGMVDGLSRALTIIHERIRQYDPDFDESDG